MVVSVGAANLTLDLIMKEKYKALFLSPETWNDARRYNYLYKDFTLPLNAVAAGFIRRIVYPSVETSRNVANVPPVNGVLDKLNARSKKAAKDVIAESKIGAAGLKDEIINFMEKRWNGTFALIGKALSKKP